MPISSFSNPTPAIKKKIKRVAGGLHRTFASKLEQGWQYWKLICSPGLLEEREVYHHRLTKCWDTAHIYKRVSVYTFRCKSRLCDVSWETTKR